MRTVFTMLSYIALLGLALSSIISLILNHFTDTMNEKLVEPIICNGCALNYLLSKEEHQEEEINDEEALEITRKASELANTFKKGRDAYKKELEDKLRNMRGK